MLKRKRLFQTYRKQEIWLAESVNIDSVWKDNSKKQKTCGVQRKPNLIYTIHQITDRWCAIAIKMSTISPIVAVIHLHIRILGNWSKCMSGTLSELYKLLVFELIISLLCILIVKKTLCVTCYNSIIVRRLNTVIGM